MAYPAGESPDQPEMVTLTFEAGIPVALNRQPMKLGELIPRLNTIAGRNGIGLIDIFEDGIMDLKSREIYEAPAAQVILKVKKTWKGPV